MTLRLHIQRLDLDTATQTSSYDFSTGVNVILGSYGTGKSSMLELIRFALGGTAEMMPAVSNNLKRVSLDVLIGDDSLRLVREVGKNRVVVTDKRDGPGEVWTSTSGGRLPRAGVRLLELLGIPATRLSKKTGSGSEPLSFFDLYRYVYLPQNDIDRSVAGHKDAFVNRKRKAVFELAYGLTDDRIRQLQVEASSLERSEQRLLVELETISQFLSEVGVPTENELVSMEEEIRAQYRDAEQRLAIARQDAEIAFTPGQDSLRDRVTNLRRMAVDSEAERAAASAAVDRGRSLVAQLALDEERQKRALAAEASLSGLEFTACPRCLQSLSGRDVPEEHCLLCTQPQAAVARGDGEISRVRSQRAESQALLEDDEIRLARISARAAEVRGELMIAVSELEQQIDRRAIVPSLDLTRDAAADREKARAKLRDIERFRDQWSKYKDRQIELDNVQKEIKNNERAQEEQQETLVQHRKRVDELSDLFDEEVRELHFAGYEHAAVDRSSYLPTVNGDSFDQLSVGGARKTLANVAYYLSLLGYTLSSAEILLPGLLILDSPRKNLGDTDEDVAAGRRIYERISVLAEHYGSTCQIIVADNGLPRLDRVVGSAFKVTRLTYPSPLLRDVPHPGADNVQTIG